MKPIFVRRPRYDEKLLAEVAAIKAVLPPKDAPAKKAPANDKAWQYLCEGKMQGGCIVFGGWLKVIPNDGDKYAYCAYGGLGIGGWNHQCSIYSKSLTLPELYSQAISCMLVSGSSLPDDPVIGASTDCIFYDKHSSIIGIAGTSAGVLAMVGGTVTWKHK